MSKTELRRYRRMGLDMPARIIVNSIDEYQGRLLNISPGDLAVKVNAKVVVGDAAVVYIKGLDVIEGRIARVMPDGFALSFILSRRRRQVLTEQLMLYANPSFAAGLSDRRGAPRHPAANERMVCRLSDGTSLFVRVVDRSVDAVALDAPRKPPIGSSIHVGRARATVVRHTQRGFVAVYDIPPVDAKSDSVTVEKGGANPTRLRAV